MNQGSVKSQKSGGAVAVRGLFLMPKPVRKAEAAEGVREGTTGRVLATLPRVWAVASPTNLRNEAKEEARSIAESERGSHRSRMHMAPGLAFYRKYTEAMLRRYLRLSMAAGRVPSLLGRELFRGQVTNYRVTNFEDVVVFCFDVERCLGELQPVERQLIKRIALQEYTQGETAAMLGMSLRACIMRYREAVDHLTDIFLRTRLMEPQKCCQEGKTVTESPSR